MHKTSAVLLSVFLISFSATPALSIINKDAGSIIKKTAEIPYKAEVDPKFDVTGFMPVQPQKKNDNEEVEIHFSADEMEDNKEQQTITARGNVNIIRENLTLIADKVIYNQKEDVVTAVDNVILVEKDGSVVFSDYLELTDQMTAAGWRAEVISAYQTAGGAPYLDYTDTVFGQVYEGMDVVDAIARTGVDEAQRPTEPITINSVTITKYE